MAHVEPYSNGKATDHGHPKRCRQRDRNAGPRTPRHRHEPITTRQRHHATATRTRPDRTTGQPCLQGDPETPDRRARQPDSRTKLRNGVTEQRYETELRNSVTQQRYETELPNSVTKRSYETTEGNRTGPRPQHGPPSGTPPRRSPARRPAGTLGPAPPPTPPPPAGRPAPVYIGFRGIFCPFWGPVIGRSGAGHGPDTGAGMCGHRADIWPLGVRSADICDRPRSVIRFVCYTADSLLYRTVRGPGPQVRVVTQVTQKVGRKTSPLPAYIGGVRYSGAALSRSGVRSGSKPLRLPDRPYGRYGVQVTGTVCLGAVQAPPGASALRRALGSSVLFWRVCICLRRSMTSGRITSSGC